ncbi:MAG: hypothetical protein AAFN08_16940 [Cyanobacteria bacterium J06559_3]
MGNRPTTSYQPSTIKGVEETSARFVCVHSSNPEGGTRTTAADVVVSA